VTFEVFMILATMCRDYYFVVTLRRDIETTTEMALTSTKGFA